MYLTFSSALLEWRPSPRSNLRTLQTISQGSRAKTRPRRVHQNAEEKQSEPQFARNRPLRRPNLSQRYSIKFCLPLWRSLRQYFRRTQTAGPDQTNNQRNNSKREPGFQEQLQKMHESPDETFSPSQEC